MQLKALRCHSYCPALKTLFREISCRRGNQVLTVTQSEYLCCQIRILLTLFPLPCLHQIHIVCLSPLKLNGFLSDISNVKHFRRKIYNMCASSVVQACLYSSNLTEWAGTSRGKKEENSYKEQITLPVIAGTTYLTFPIYSKFRCSMTD